MRSGKNSARVRLKLVGMATLLVWVVMPLAASAARAQQSAAPKRALVLYWYNKDFPGNLSFDRSFQTILRSASAGTVEYYPEYLNSDRFPGENQSLLLYDYLRKKYANITIDVVVAYGYATQHFLLKHRDDLFPHTPIVFVTGRPVEEVAAAPDVTGIVLYKS